MAGGEALRDVHCDVLVVGAGVGGLSAALAAAKRGLDVLVAEKSEVFGGMSAWSGGWLWIPGNHIMVRDGVADSVDAARTYLRNRLGDEYEPDLVEAYLSSGPAMVEEYARDTAVQFEGAGYIFPDYHPETPGSVHGSGVSRSIRAVPIDGRELKPATLAHLRRMLPQTTLHGMMLASLVEAQHFVNAFRSPASAVYVARKVSRYVRDVCFHGRDMWLVNGNALIARLAKSLDALNVPIHVSSPVTELVLEASSGGAAGVLGAIVQREGIRERILAKRGVVLACGGFGHNRDRQKQHYSHVAAGGQHFAVAPESDSGDGAALAERAGGHVLEGRAWNCLFMPVSRLPGKSGSAAVVPHIWDRSKPGFIAVTPGGKRFVNEAASYMGFGQAMVRASHGSSDVRGFIVCDAKALGRYGLGAARPMLPLGGFLRSGYIKRGDTLQELAAQIGIPGDALEQTVTQYNADARNGRDSAFHKGEDPFSRFQGDPDVRPNPNVAPLEKPPFYAVEIFCGDFGAFTGIRANADAQVLRRDGSPIRGLYAVGNDMATMMGSHSVGGGISLGPAMVFGYRAAVHMAGTKPPTQ